MVSSKDVAKKAGVSQTTVSRVLNTPELVKKPTVDKVMRAIEELNYIPNANARSLVQNKTKTIALLSGPIHNPFFVDTTTAIINYANEKGYRVHVQYVDDERLQEAYTSILENKVDGVILSCIFWEDPMFFKLKQLDIPFITYNRKHKNNEFFVEIDNFYAGYLSAQHLLELGHTAISWVGGPQNRSTFKERYAGFIKALEDYNIAKNDDYIFTVDTSKQSIQDLFQHITSLDKQPTGICAATDSIALHLLDCFITKNLKVPDDISIIGIDNVDLSKHGMIQLTTVGSILEENLGFLAIKELFEMIENKKNSCVRITKPVKVFNRRTTSAPKQTIK
ncbi:LacI family DNA-binding transcriptional regulator [Lysinibacillus sp. FSL H8-0500]|uniref:Transcriptional regulator n=1 Tax=Lysinibacillus macroides TaxID=33935 RepID=A0A0M9DM45_9BACI|nr:LacI family DNA-binding transcriptional regulator [Lysinibacillus macroides]KOY83180.1 transcriptional regulator [Lysinibacillus macroides]QPR69037.1 LacI family DNA-binding transcriptional regulator [Lysinibacillus macroides]